MLQATQQSYLVNKKVTTIVKTMTQWFIKLRALNIRDRIRGNLKAALLAIKEMNIGISFLSETKVTSKKYTSGVLFDIG